MPLRRTLLRLCALPLALALPGVAVSAASAQATTRLVTRLASADAATHPSVRATVTVRAPAVPGLRVGVAGRLSPRLSITDTGSCRYRASVDARLGVGDSSDPRARVGVRQGGRSLDVSVSGSSPVEAVRTTAAWKIGRLARTSELAGWWAVDVDAPGSDGRRVWLDLRLAAGARRGSPCSAAAQRAALHRLRLLLGGLRVRVVLAPSRP